MNICYEIFINYTKKFDFIIYLVWVDEQILILNITPAIFDEIIMIDTDPINNNCF